MRLLGNRGEDLAAGFLRKKGYRILSRNYRSPVGEADIIAEEGRTIVFIEVKTRTDDSFGRPFEAVDYRKREKIKRIALYYLKRYKITDRPLRFDVMSIEMSGENSRIEHITDAFE